VIEVVGAGLLSSVQTATGRPGWRRLGIPVGGAADPWSARLASRLVAMPDDAPVIEVTLGGAAFRFGRRAIVAHAGGTRLIVDGLEVAASAASFVRAGTTVRVEPGGGARGYLAVGGGIMVETLLGSASTDLRSGFGGLDGRALRDGDRLRLGPPSRTAMRSTATPPSGPIRVVDGPHGTASELEGLWATSDEADRAGVRLDGRRLAGGEIRSIGLPLGAVQVPPDGRPIVMLADRPVTGGYRVAACVIRADIGRVAQLRPGDRFVFEAVSAAEARHALARREDELAAIEPLEAPAEDDPAWAGSHG